MNKPIEELIQILNELNYKYYGCELSRREAELIICELSRSEAELTISALEKQIPKKPIEEQGITPRCPCCENANYLTNEDEEENSYCGNCGQAIDWGDRDD